MRRVWLLIVLIAVLSVGVSAQECFNFDNADNQWQFVEFDGEDIESDVFEIDEMPGALAANIRINNIDDFLTDLAPRATFERKAEFTEERLKLPPGPNPNKNNLAADKTHLFLGWVYVDQENVLRVMNYLHDDDLIVYVANNCGNSPIINEICTFNKIKDVGSGTQERVFYEFSLGWNVIAIFVDDDSGGGHYLRYSPPTKPIFEQDNVELFSDPTLLSTPPEGTVCLNGQFVNPNDPTRLAIQDLDKREIDDICSRSTNFDRCECVDVDCVRHADCAQGWVCNKEEKICMPQADLFRPTGEFCEEKGFNEHVSITQDEITFNVCQLADDQLCFEQQAAADSEAIQIAANLGQGLDPGLNQLIEQRNREREQRTRQVESQIQFEQDVFDVQQCNDPRNAVLCGCYALTCLDDTNCPESQKCTKSQNQLSGICLPQAQGNNNKCIENFVVQQEVSPIRIANNNNDLSKVKENAPKLCQLRRGNLCINEAGRCYDGLDNDGDRKIDCQDTDCIGQVGPDATICLREQAVEFSCADGEDNDDDGLIDCADTDCHGLLDDEDFGCTQNGFCADPVCEDGVCEESSCTCLPGFSLVNGACVAGESLCNDNIDNDGNSKVDCNDAACNERGCQQFGDEESAMCIESTCVETNCKDGLDNDGDTKIDCRELDCRSQIGPNNHLCCITSEDCGGGATCIQNQCKETSCIGDGDDDGDGLSDCADPDCEALLCEGSGRNAKQCISGACTAIDMAQAAPNAPPVVVRTIFSYPDMLESLSECQVLRGDGTGNQICQAQQKICILANGGRVACSDTANKATCC